MNMRNRSLFTILSVAALSLCALASSAVGQSKAQKQKSPQGQAPLMSHWKVSVSADEPARVTLLAEDAPLVKIASEIAAKLGAPVVLSPLMKAQRVTAEFTDAPLESALRLLAPQPFVDYALGGGYEAQPKLLGVYLHALNESPPPVTASVKAASQAILIEGDTEDPESLPSAKAKTDDEPVLKVSFDQHLLSVRARRQPLTAALYEIASKLGAPFEMQNESTEIIDLEWAGRDVADLWRRLPAHARLYLRKDLQIQETKTLRIVLLKANRD